MPGWPNRPDAHLVWATGRVREEGRAGAQAEGAGRGPKNLELLTVKREADQRGWASPGSHTVQSRLSPSTCPLSRSWGQVFTKLSHVAPGLPWIFPLEPSFRLKWQMPNRGSVTPEPVIGALAGLSLGAPKVTAHLHQGMCCSGWGCSPRRLQVCSSQMATHRAPLAAAKPHFLNFLMWAVGECSSRPGFQS